MPKPDSLQGSRQPRRHAYLITSAINHAFDEAIRAEWITQDTGRRARLCGSTAEGKKQLLAEESRRQTVTSALDRAPRTM